MSDERGALVINSTHEIWDNPAVFLRRVNEEGHEFSTADPRHPIAHELGELATHQSIGWEAFTAGQPQYEANEDLFQGDAATLSHIYDILGDRATVSHTEFVAETVAALLLGRGDELQANEWLMDRFRQYGGEALTPTLRRLRK